MPAQADISQSVATVLGIVYLVIVPIFVPFLYNCWAALVLEILAVFAWLIVFAIMTAWASANTAAKLYNSAYGLDSVLWAGPGRGDYYGMRMPCLARKGKSSDLRAKNNR